MNHQLNRRRSVLAGWFYVIAGSSLLLWSGIERASARALEGASNWARHVPALLRAEFVGHLLGIRLSSHILGFGSGYSVREIAAALAVLIAWYLFVD